MYHYREISTTDRADKLLDLNPLHDLAVQGILLLLEVVGTEVNRPAPGIFPDHLLAERTLDLFQFRVLVVQMFLQGFPRGKPFRTVLTRDLLLLIGFLGFTRWV